MFSCYVHNWSHAFNQCPLCPSRVVTTSSDSTEPLELGDPDIIPRWAHTQSELTKLRARVALLEEALGFYGSPESWIIRDKDSWKKSSPRSYGDDEIILNYQHPNRDWVGTIDVGGKRARTALQRSKELGDG